MKTLEAYSELSTFDIQKAGLTRIRDEIRINLLMQIKNQLDDQWMNLATVESYTDPLTGLMRFKATLRLYEKGDCIPVRYHAFEAPPLTIGGLDGRHM